MLESSGWLAGRKGTSLKAQAAHRPAGRKEATPIDSRAASAVRMASPSTPTRDYQTRMQPVTYRRKGRSGSPTILWAPYYSMGSILTGWKEGRCPVDSMGSP